MSIYGSAVKKPITTLMIFIAIVVFGAYSLVNLPIDLYPEIELPAISVLTTYGGANASDIEAVVCDGQIVMENGDILTLDEEEWVSNATRYAYERFTEQGPLAILPLADRRAAFIWTVSEDDAERVLALGDAEFLEELREQFGNRLGGLSKVGQRVAYPLQLSKALRLTTERSVLVGNAAHGLHPVAAQGFNLGMRDVAALCDCIADAQNAGNGFDPGDARLLERYVDWRSADQKKLVGFTDGLVKLFGSSRRPLRALRNIGMLGFDLIPGVRSLFAKHTMGLAGNLPRLSRGVPLK